MTAFEKNLAKQWPAALKETPQEAGNKPQAKHSKF
jgi:hypothetical protein